MDWLTTLFGSGRTPEELRAAIRSMQSPQNIEGMMGAFGGQGVSQVAPLARKALSYAPQLEDLIYREMNPEVQTLYRGYSSEHGPAHGNVPGLISSREGGYWMTPNFEKANIYAGNLQQPFGKNIEKATGKFNIFDPLTTKNLYAKDLYDEARQLRQQRRDFSSIKDVPRGLLLKKMNLEEKLLEYLKNKGYQGVKNPAKYQTDEIMFFDKPQSAIRYKG